MRIWDIAAGYLSRQSLLGEHAELHALHSILLHRMRGFSHHPETLRWVGCLSGLARRHEALVAEMRLRGYDHRTPLPGTATPPQWPTGYVTPPAEQYALLRERYLGKDAGRIPLPHNAQDLWSHHKYSVLARDLATYRSIGRCVARMRRGADFFDLAEELATILRQTPPHGGLVNAIEHMWGHVSRAATAGERNEALGHPLTMLFATQQLAVRTGEPYLTASTALSELAVFLSTTTVQAP